MTQRDPPKPLGEPTYTEPPVVTASVGHFPVGLADHVTDAQLTALKLMSGLTIDPDVIHINGNRRVIEQLDENNA